MGGTAGGNDSVTARQDDFQCISLWVFAAALATSPNSAGQWQGSTSGTCDATNEEGAECVSQ